MVLSVHPSLYYSIYRYFSLTIVLSFSWFCFFYVGILYVLLFFYLFSLSNYYSAVLLFSISLYLSHCLSIILSNILSCSFCSRCGSIIISAVQSFGLSFSPPFFFVLSSFQSILLFFFPCHNSFFYYFYFPNHSMQRSIFVYRSHTQVREAVLSRLICAVLLFWISGKVFLWRLDSSLFWALSMQQLPWRSEEQTWETRTSTTTARLSSSLQSTAGDGCVWDTHSSAGASRCQLVRSIQSHWYRLNKNRVKRKMYSLLSHTGECVLCNKQTEVIF